MIGTVSFMYVLVFILKISSSFNFLIVIHLFENCKSSISTSLIKHVKNPERLKDVKIQVGMSKLKAWWP